jgi:hypothetical protein
LCSFPYPNDYWNYPKTASGKLNGGFCLAIDL